MPLTNPNKVVTEERLSEFYGQILPYMGGMPDVLANKFSKGDLYSTDEKMIGVWVDNKPLYQKTVTTGGSVPSGATLIQRTTQTGYDTILYTKTTDSPIAIGSESDYDSTEKIVGTWFGEDLWQKTIDCGALPNNTEKSIAHGISNIDTNVIVFGYSSDGTNTLPLPFAHPVATSLISCMADKTYVKIVTGKDRTSYTNTFVTLQYTKTS